MTRKKRRKINKARKPSNKSNLRGMVEVLLGYVIIFIILGILLDLSCGAFKGLLAVDDKWRIVNKPLQDGKCPLE